MRVQLMNCLGFAAFETGISHSIISFNQLVWSVHPKRQVKIAYKNSALVHWDERAGQTGSMKRVFQMI